MSIRNSLASFSRIFRSTPSSPLSPQEESFSSLPSRDELLAIIPIDQSLTDRWDREWLHYFLHEDPRPFLVNHENLKIISNLQGKQPAEVYNTSLTAEERLGELRALSIWFEGNHLVDKNLLEIGCGPGFLAKQLAKVAASYVGIDYSRLALHIARLTSPSNCSYYHLSELDHILQHANTIDSMVGRNFFIHQNYRNLIWLLKLASVLLKPGGLISADFYLGNPDVPQGIIHPAHSDLDERYPSCGFEYTRQDIQQAAQATGFSVEAIFDNSDLQRRFVHFIKPM